MPLFRRKSARNHARPFLTAYPSNSQFAEAYRNLRTNIAFSFTDKNFQTLLVTSAGQEEGKTSTVYNLAYTMAKAGQSVLMVDADLRKPMLSRNYRKGDSPGLSGIVSRVFSHDIRSGRLGEEGMGLADLIRLVGFQKGSGRLRLVEGGQQVTLGFFKGALVDLDWHTRPEEKKLAQVLLRDKRLTQEQVRAALLRQKDSGHKLGVVLMHMGLLGQDDLRGPLALHMMEGLRCALDFKAADYTFKALPETDMTPPAFNPVDFDQLYRQLVLGEEPLGFLQRRIDAAVRPEADTGLHVLPAGKLPPNPSELLGSERTTFLFDYLRRRFDRIVVDSAPILPATDALLLAPHADGVVLVVKAGHLNRAPVQAAVEQLRTTQANIVGVVLNQLDHRKEGYYKYYHKYYQGYYGDQADDR